MYAVSNDYKAMLSAPVQKTHIRGTIGAVSFDEYNVLEGSLTISNACADTQGTLLGSVYVGQL